jgi:hypothetical protein
VWVVPAVVAVVGLLLILWAVGGCAAPTEQSPATASPTPVASDVEAQAACAVYARAVTGESDAGALAICAEPDALAAVDGMAASICESIEARVAAGESLEIAFALQSAIIATSVEPAVSAAAAGEALGAVVSWQCPTLYDRYVAEVGS